jgi:imidazolonepropionase-like amidohydrolase
MKSHAATIFPFCMLALMGLAGTCQAEDISRYIVANAPVIALTEALLIDGTGGTPVAKQTVIIREGRITHIGPAHEVHVPENAHRIDLNGKALLPGWVMLHEHLYNSPTWKDPVIVTEQPASYPKLYLAAGVTSARTAGSIEPYTDLRIKEAIAAGTMIGPEIDLTAPYLEGEPGAVLQLHPLDSAQAAREHVRFWAGLGFTSFKAYMFVTPEQLGAAIDEAHRLGLKVTGHLCSVTYREAASLGIDQIEHGFYESSDFQPDKAAGRCDPASQQKSLVGLAPDDKRVQSLISYLIERDVTVTSTLAVYAHMAQMLPAMDESEVAFLDKSSMDYYQDYLARGAKHASGAGTILARQAVKASMNLEAAFWRAGGRLVVGSDAVPPGSMAGNENLTSIELLAEAGIPPLDVIQIATRNGAEALGISNDRGTIAVGKRADLIVINGNPAIDIRDIRNIEIVFKNGLGYDPVALRESVIGAIGGPRP